MRKYRIKQFSMVELLVVISIITILVAATAGGASLLIDRAKRMASQAKTIGVKMAIEAFARDNNNMLPVSNAGNANDTIIYNEDQYSVVPLKVLDSNDSTNNTLASKIFSLKNYVQFISKLGGDTTGKEASMPTEYTTRINKRKKAYLKFEGSTSAAVDDTFVNVDYKDYLLEQFEDSWGNYLVILLDTNYDGVIKYKVDGTIYKVRAKVLVLSGGPDGIKAAPAPENDGFALSIPKSW